MVDIQTVYYVVETAVGICVLGGFLWGFNKWRKENGRESKKKDEEKIACDNCQTVFTPKWKERKLRSGKILDVAVCPQCGEDNEFEVEENGDDE